ncbi:MAG: ATP-dependent DNA helicase RecQ [Planctomycetota bacterium]
MVTGGGVRADTLTLDAVRQEVAARWGFAELRPMQAEAIEAAVEGRDAVVVMPTGGGKSLCYQAPALVDARPHVVVSPLVALMEDQVASLRALGAPAACLHSQLDPRDSMEIEESVRAGELRLLYAAPERLLSGRTLSLLREVKPAALVIDEAHCISQWGHDFRPHYRRLAELRRALPDLAIRAFTATATPRVREDIAHQLELRDPAMLVGDFHRANLTYRVVPRTDRLGQIEAVCRRHAGRAVIAYANSRKQTEQIAEGLGRRGIEARAYHAGMGGEARRAIERDFARERVNVIVATVAFGMGIDRSDVRAVVHAGAPKSIEAYAQETGRAGRDGMAAECVLLYAPGDIVQWKRLLNDSPIGQYDEHGNELDTDAALAARAHQVALLEEMRRFASSPACRHAQLCAYFGQSLASDGESSGCGACDVCLGEVALMEGATEVAQQILSAVARCEQRFGARHIASVLRGERDERIERLGHDQLSVFGLMKGATVKRIGLLIDQLLDQELLAKTGEEYPVLALTGRSLAVLRGQETVTLTEPPAGTSTARRSSGHAEVADLTPSERALFEKLRGLRREIAESQDVPAYVVFSDATLRSMSRIRPRTVPSMRRVSGVGETKLERYGQAFFDAIEVFCETTPLSRDAPG